MKLRFRTKVSYGIGGVADNAIYTLVATYLMFFLTSVAGIKPAVAGTIAAIGTVWEAICGPTVGFLSDNLETRYGKRKPFLILASVPSVIVITLLFTVVDASEGIKTAYYAVMVLLLWQVFALFYVPYMSWGSELTEDYEERTELRSFAYVGNQVGMIMGMVLPTALTAFLMARGSSLEKSWQIVGLIIGSAVCFVLLYCSLTIKLTDNPNFKKTKRISDIMTAKNIGRMFKEFILIFHLKPAKFIISSSVIFLIANTFFNSAIIYNATYRMRLESTLQTVLLITIAVAGICISPFIAKIAIRTDKTKTFQFGMIIAGVILIALGFLDIDSFAGGLLLCAAFAIGNASYWQLMPSMLYDVCDAEDLASGARHSGQVIATQALSESVAEAIAVWLLGIVLQTNGFVELSDVQSAEAIHAIGWCTSVIPGALFIVVAIVFSGHTIHKDSYARILDALARRDRGEVVDMNEFKDVYGKKLKGVRGIKK